MVVVEEDTVRRGDDPLIIADAGIIIAVPRANLAIGEYASVNAPGRPAARGAVAVLQSLAAIQVNRFVRGGVLEARKGIAFVKSGFKPASLIVQASHSAASRVDTVVFCPAEQCVRKAVVAADEIERVVV